MKKPGEAKKHHGIKNLMNLKKEEENKMQKIGYRLRNILLLAMLILVAGAAASIAEDQLSPQGPKVIGRLFGMEAQAEEYLDYDLTKYNGQDLRIEITKADQYVRLTQSNKKTPVNVNITLVWNAKFAVDVQALARVYMDSINIGSGTIKIEKGTNFGGSNQSLIKQVGLYYSGDNVIKSTTDAYVISCAADDIELGIKNASGVQDNTAEGIRLINTKAPDKTLSIKGGTWLMEYYTYLGVSGLEKQEKVSRDKNKTIAGLIQTQFPVSDMPKDALGCYQNLGYAFGNSRTNVYGYIGEDGKFSAFVNPDKDVFSDENKNKDGYSIVLSTRGIISGGYKGTVKENLTIYTASDGYSVSRLVGSLKISSVSRPIVNKVTANSVSMEGLNDQVSGCLYDTDGTLLETAETIGGSVVFDNLESGKLYKATVKYKGIESDQTSIVAFGYEDKITLRNGVANVRYSETLNIRVTGVEKVTYRLVSEQNFPSGVSSSSLNGNGEFSYLPQTTGTMTVMVELIPYVNGSPIWQCPAVAPVKYTIKDSPDTPEMDTFSGSSVTLKNVRNGIEYQCYEGANLKSSQKAYADGTLTFSGLTPGKLYSFSGRAPGSGSLQPGPSSPAILVKTFEFAPAPANGVYQNEYSQKVAAAQAGNYSYTVAAGTLPEGLSLAADGTINGTPAKAGAATVSLKATATDAGLVADNSITKEVTITIDKAKPQTPAAAPRVNTDTVGTDTLSLIANAVPDAGTIADLAKAPYEYAFISVNGQKVDAPAWQENLEFTGLNQGSSYTFAARFKATENTTASDASAGSTAVTTKVAVKVPKIALEDDSPCTTEGQVCQITSDATHKGETPANAVLNVGDTVTYTVTPCTEHSFRKLSINGTDLTDGEYTVDQGVVTATYTLKAEDSDVLAKAVMGDKQVVAVEPMKEYKILANAAPNKSGGDLTADINNVVNVRYRYDNNTVLEDQTTTWTMDRGQSHDPKGGTWKYSGTEVNGITPKLDAVVTPVTGKAEAIAPVTKAVRLLGYADAAALGISDKVVVNYDNNVDKALTNIMWDSLPAGFGKTAATHTLNGQLSGVPEWATVNKDVSVDITIVDAKILKVAGVSVKDKVYDGTTDAELVVDEGGIVLADEDGNVINNIKADATNAAASYKTADAGAGIGITVTGVELTSDEQGFDPSRYALDFSSVSGTISKATPEITAPTTEKATYGTALKDITLKGGKATVGGQEYKGTFSWKNGEEIPNVENQGYTAVFTPDDANNLNSAETTVAVALDKKAVVVTPDAGQAKTYGDADPALTYTLDAELAAGNEMTGALSRVSGETVGDYAIEAGTLSAGSNYSLTVTPDVTFKVNQKDITPVAAAEDREYKAGDTDATVTVTLPEVLAADQKEVTAINYRGKFADDKVGNPKTVTVSNIQLFGPKADNYRLTTTEVTTRAAITNVWPKITEAPTAAGITYGQKLSDTALEGGAAVDKNNSTVTVPGHFEWAEPNKVPDAGSYSAKVKFVPDDQANYGTATLENPVVVAVAKREVTVTPGAGQTKIYGEQDPEALTYTVAEGAILDDGAVLTGALTREPGEDAGSYAIINNNLSAGGNYSIVVADESFVISPKNVTVTAEAADRAYIPGNVDAEVTLTVIGAIGGDDVKATKTSATFADDAVGMDKIVTVSGIALTGEKAGNYLLPEDAKTVTAQASITNASVEITSAPTAKNGITYGQPLSDVVLEGGTAVDAQSRAEVAGAFTWKTPEQVLTDIGEAQATVIFTPEDLENYGKSEAQVTVTVAKKAINVAPAADQTKVFGSGDPNSYGFAISEETPLVGEDKLMDVLTRAEGEDVGEYAYSLTESAKANTHYTITLTDADTIKFSITKATPAAPVMPVLKSSTSDTVTLETIEVTDPVAVKAGAAVEYGIIDAENATKWQAEPVFTGLKGDTTYRFTARHGATNNTEASAASDVLEVKTPVGGIVIDTPTIVGVPEGTEGISVTADKLGEAVNAGDEVVFTLTGNKAKEASYVPYGFTINGEAVECGKIDKDTRSCQVTYTVQAADVEKGSIDAEALFTRLGNINTDDKINAGDALLIQRSAAGLGNPLSAEKMVAADVNMDGRVNAGDALVIKRYAAGLTPAL